MSFKSVPGIGLVASVDIPRVCIESNASTILVRDWLDVCGMIGLSQDSFCLVTWFSERL